MRNDAKKALHPSNKPQPCLLRCKKPKTNFPPIFAPPRGVLRTKNHLEQESEFDPDTRWALTWFDQYGFSEGRFGDAETLSKAKDTSVSSMAEAGIIVARGGKVRLLKKNELSSEWSQDGHRITVWEVAHQLLSRLETDGETGAALLVKQLGTICETAHDLAYRLFKISERRKWIEDAVSYNSLAASWTEIIRLAAERDTTAAQAKLGY